MKWVGKKFGMHRNKVVVGGDEKAVGVIAERSGEGSTQHTQVSE